MGGGDENMDGHMKKIYLIELPPEMKKLRGFS